MSRYALAIWTASGNQVGVAYATLTLAQITARSGDVADGMDLLVDSLDRFDALGAVALAIEARVRRVEVHLLADAPDQARSEAAEVWTRLTAGHHGDAELVEQLEPLMVLADLRLGDVEAAAARLDTIHASSEHRDNTYVEALVAAVSAELDDATNHPARADVSRRRAWRLFDSLDVVAVPSVLDGPYGR